MHTTSNKPIIESLVNLFVAKGLENIVLSPGSRNAPLIIAFASHPKINAISIVDERSAAFFALGMAQKLGKPVAIAATSGSAVLNYAPAISEAYYQHIPLIVLTADRPPEWIDQGEGQAINQNNIYNNYIKTSVNLPVEAYTNEELWFAERLINQTINLAFDKPYGPAHINIPLREPIYGKKTASQSNVKIFSTIETEKILSDFTWSEVLLKMDLYSKVMILVGTMEPDNDLLAALNNLAIKGIVILTETISNLNAENFFTTIDRDITIINNDTLIQQLAPELLITMGHSIISKRIKEVLRKNKPKEHWHVGFEYESSDTYQSLTISLPVEELYFFKNLNEKINAIDNRYFIEWQKIHLERMEKHSNYINNSPWSDFVAYNSIFTSIPNKSEIQLGNSTPARYAQLFNFSNQYTWHSNRGTSGIDGCTSTAAGFASLHNKTTVLLTGDISFFYDINALWNNNLTPNFKIIILNNSGGGIFKYIPGPDTTEQLEEFFETKQYQRNASHIALMHNIEYFAANNQQELDGILKTFFIESARPQILEIFTPSGLNAQILREYFKFLNK